jgi:hypothetical protein
MGVIAQVEVEASQHLNFSEPDKPVPLPPPYQFACYEADRQRPGHVHQSQGARLGTSLARRYFVAAPRSPTPGQVLGLAYPNRHKTPTATLATATVPLENSYPHGRALKQQATL